MQLTVLSIGYSFATVSEDTVGGTEQIVRQVDGTQDYLSLYQSMAQRESVETLYA